MSLSTIARIAAVALAASIAASCSKDPNVAKRESFDRGNQYVTQKKYKEAIVEYRKAIQLDARFGEARYKLAEAYVQVDDPQNAFREYVRAADLLPDNTDAQVKAGAVLLLAGRFEDAKVRADTVLKKNPKNVDALILRARAMAELKDLDGAVARMEEAVELGPDQGRVFTNLGMLELARGKRDEAEAAFKKAVEIEPQSAAAHLALANYYWAIGRLADAETSLNRAIELSPNDERANRSLATLYVVSGRVEQAEKPLKVVAESSKDPAPRFLLADYYLMTKRTKEAATLLEALATDKASFAQAKLRVALVEYDGGRRDQAHKTIDAVLAQEPKNPRALLLKGRLLLAERKLDDAQVRVETAIVSDPKSLQGYYLLGTIFIAKNERDEAIKAFNQVLTLGPRTADAQIWLARLHLARGDAETSVRFAGEAITNQPANPLAHMMLAQGLMVRGELVQAESELKLLLAANPKSAEIQTEFGRLSLLKKNAAAARQFFTRALELDSNSTEALRGLVTLDIEAKKPADARAKVEARLAKKSDDPDLLHLAAATYDASGDAARREEVLRKIVEVDPANLDAYAALGRIYYSAGKLDQARGEFEEMLKRQPKSIASQTMVAMILQLQSKGADAQKSYEKVLELDPHAAVAANNLAWLHAQNGVNLDVALQLAQTAKSQLPKQPEIADTLGWIYYKKNLGSLAVRELREAVEAAPKNPTYQYHLGLAYAKTGDKENARQHLERALKLKPDFEGAADARKLLASL